MRVSAHALTKIVPDDFVDCGRGAHARQKNGEHPVDVRPAERARHGRWAQGFERSGDGEAKNAQDKKSPGNKGRVSGAEHVPNGVHPGLAPLREVEQGRTISKSSATIIDTSEIKRFALW